TLDVYDFSSQSLPAADLGHLWTRLSCLGHEPFRVSFDESLITLRVCSGVLLCSVSDFASLHSSNRRRCFDTIGCWLWRNDLFASSAEGGSCRVGIRPRECRFWAVFSAHCSLLPQSGRTLGEGSAV